jgi:hypothetical protein
MLLYERKNDHNKWYLVDSFPVTVGRAGLAKGCKTPVFLLLVIVPTKHEGDGKIAFRHF